MTTIETATLQGRGLFLRTVASFFAALVLALTCAGAVALGTAGTFAFAAEPVDSAEAVAPADDSAYAVEPISVEGEDYAAPEFILDYYGLMDQATVDNLEARCQSLANKYGVGVYLLVVDDIGDKTARDFAIMYYNNYGLGLGSDASGILFLIAIDSRDYVTITQGQGIYYFTDYQIEEMEESIVSYLSQDQFVDGCKEYVSQCEETLNYASVYGEPLDYDNDPNGGAAADAEQNRSVGILVSFVVGIVLAVGVCIGLRKQLKSVAVAKNASQYELKSKFKVTSKSDRFMGSFVTKTPKPQDNDSGGSSIGSGGFGGSSGGKF